jgi:putative two-component system hydrogenase maturation factor HypX/HoxX
VARSAPSGPYPSNGGAGDAADYRAQVAALAEQLAASPGYPSRLAAKSRQLAAAEKQRPLAAYRAAELAIMRRNFSGPGEPYPELRRAFVYKEKPLRTPSHLARTGLTLGPPLARPPRRNEGTADGPRGCQLTSIPGRRCESFSAIPAE